MRYAGFMGGISDENGPEYRRYARECLEWANIFHQPQARETLLHMAQVWLRLAQDVEVQEMETASQPD